MLMNWLCRCSSISVGITSRRHFCFDLCLPSIELLPWSGYPSCSYVSAAFDSVDPPHPHTGPLHRFWLFGQAPRIVLYSIVFIHFYNSASPFRSAPDHSNWHCVGVYTPKRYRQLQAKDLPKIPTLAAKAGFEPTTLRSKGVVSANAPPSPTIMA